MTALWGEHHDRDEALEDVSFDSSDHVGSVIYVERVSSYKEGGDNYEDCEDMKEDEEEANKAEEETKEESKEDEA